MKFDVKALKALKSTKEADGLVDMDSWVQAPTPTTARPGEPSAVTWVRGMGNDEATGILAMHKTVTKTDPDYHKLDRNAALAVVRAFQVLKKPVPAGLLTHWSGAVPPLKGQYYYSATQIVRSAPDVSNLVAAVEEATEMPYVTALEPFFLASYVANGKRYAPSDAMARALENPPYVSKAAAMSAKQSQGKSNAVTTATLTPPTKGGANSIVGMKRGADGAAKSITPAKTTDSAREAMSDYVKVCKKDGLETDPAVMSVLAALED